MVLTIAYDLNFIFDCKLLLISGFWVIFKNISILTCLLGKYFTKFAPEK